MELRTADSTSLQHRVRYPFFGFAEELSLLADFFEH